MNPSFLSLAMSKKTGQVGFLSLHKATSREQKLQIQLALLYFKKLTLCHILLEEEDLGKYILFTHSWEEKRWLHAFSKVISIK